MGTRQCGMGTRQCGMGTRQCGMGTRQCGMEWNEASQVAIKGYVTLLTLHTISAPVAPLTTFGHISAMLLSCLYILMMQ